MADAVSRDDSSLDLVAGKSHASLERGYVLEIAERRRSRMVSVAVGFGCAAVFLAYYVAGSVRIEAGTRSGVRYRVETIWSDFTEYLVRQGASAQIVIAVAALAVISVLGSCLLIGLALAIRDNDSRAE